MKVQVVSESTFKRILRNRTPNSTQLHLYPPSSSQPPSSSIYIHPAHFSLDSASSISIQLISASTQFFATPSTLLEPTYCTCLGNFLKFTLKISKLSILTEIWDTRYIEGADFESGLTFLNFQP